MCTLSFRPVAAGFDVAMNRDERLVRPCADLPAVHYYGSRCALHPAELSGGTWIAVDSNGRVSALLNFHPKNVAVANPQRSRGTLIPSLLEGAHYDRDWEKGVERECPGLAPFRLVQICGARRSIREASWDGTALNFRSRRWRLRHWFSSSIEEAHASKERTLICQQAMTTDGPPVSLRRLHSTHHPILPYGSICVHRADARTVSYTEINVRDQTARMSYFPDSPCRTGQIVRSRLTLEANA